MSIKIETIPGKLSFAKLQDQICNTANSIKEMENKTIEKKDLEGWILFASIRKTTIKTLIELMDMYIDNMTKIDF